MTKIWGIAILFILIDQISKIYIKLHFLYGETHSIFSWFQISFIENPGMAYGYEFGGYAGKIALTLLRLGLVSFGIYYLYNKINLQWNKYLIWIVGLILGGAIGNLIDSMFYGLMFDRGLTFIAETGEFTRYYEGIAKLNFDGYSGFLGGCVVDMLHFPIIDTILPEWVPIWGGQRFEFFKPVFNIADSCISVGIAILLIFRKKALPEGFKF